MRWHGLYLYLALLLWWLSNMSYKMTMRWCVPSQWVIYHDLCLVKPNTTRHMLYPPVLRCSTVFQPIVTVYAYIVKVSHDHVLLLRICNNLMHMWHHVTNHLIISNDKNSNSENRIKLRICDRDRKLSKRGWMWRQWLCKVCQRGCMRDVAEALQSILQGPSDTRSQSYRLLAKLSSLIY
jgi:hypothetical protein